MRRYCHVGTGNYNPKTARLYEDLGLLTCDPEIGADLTQLFNFLTGYARDVDYRKLLVAPHDLRPGLTELIEQREQAAGDAARIVVQDEQPRRRRDDRRALPGLAGRRRRST